MQRRPSTQDLTWLVDLYLNKQLNLNPPYQRRSVWTRKDKQFFLDTIFRNYPSPAIFLHKTLDEAGKATYHVVDGKQRTQTILDFVNDKIRMASNYGDVRLDGKKWSNLQGEQALKQKFWNYQLTVEMIDIVDGTVVNEVFERLNRNSRKLTQQELRHAKFDGWLITTAEEEAEKEEWRSLGIATPARVKRMVDTQFISELLVLMLEQRVMGFDQDTLDELYAKYEDPSDTCPELDQDAFMKRFSEVKAYLLKMNGQKDAVATYSKGFGNFYTLWALVALAPKLSTPKKLVAGHTAFMQKVQTLAEQQDLEAFLRKTKSGEYTIALTYLNNSRGASTDLGPRTERLAALRKALLD